MTIAILAQIIGFVVLGLVALLAIGQDSLCLVRRGALVTGLDFSGAALKVARRSARELWTRLRICHPVRSIWSLRHGEPSVAMSRRIVRFDMTKSDLDCWPPPCIRLARRCWTAAAPSRLALCATGSAGLRIKGARASQVERSSSIARSTITSILSEGTPGPKRARNSTAP